MAYFYTADPHFGHANILKYCKRPFENIDQMNGAILKNYQNALQPKDDLWIIGDFAFAKDGDQDRLNSMLASIPGRKHLITGNHDRPWMRNLSGWHSVHDLIEIKDMSRRVTLCHYPMLTFPGARRGAMHLFGHVHGNWLGCRNSINAGVDCWNFKPIKLEDAIRRGNTLPELDLWAKVEGK